VVQDAIAAGIDLRCGGRLGAVDAQRRELEWNGERLGFGRAINTAGLHADRIAHLFGVCTRYKMLPFKGLYWQLDPASGIRPKHLIYPVPDLRVPFLGIHTTTAVNGNVYVGPTAVPALGRENYRGFKGVDAAEAVAIAGQLARMVASGREGFRSLAWQECLRFLKPRFAAAARRLLPRLSQSDLIACDKVGIRAQLFDRTVGVLVSDFLVQRGLNSIHVLNAVSPAFTSAFPLARHVCESELRL
jgi:L-2-hydroxyglutarate oxidase LhgO